MKAYLKTYPSLRLAFFDERYTDPVIPSGRSVDQVGQGIVTKILFLSNKSKFNGVVVQELEVLAMLHVIQLI
jgi:hypothetical protein